MPNTYFQFKQFRIEQDRCSMKVCTDACIQGAYAVHWIKNEQSLTLKMVTNILDIGTGTGLLALMLAQKIVHAHIDAVEINPDTYEQAQGNVLRSPWQERIQVIQGNILTLNLGKKYDFIISNPPFYENEKKSIATLKNQAKHSTLLTHKELIHAVINNLGENGTFCLMLPEKQFNVFKSSAIKNGLEPYHLLRIQQTPSHSFFRIIGFFCKKVPFTTSEDLCIKDENNSYSIPFVNLLKDYYLYLEA